MKNVGIVGFQEQKFLLNVLIVKQEVGMEKLKEIKMISKAILFDPQLFAKTELYCESRETNINDLISVLLTKLIKEQDGARRGTNLSEQKD